MASDDLAQRTAVVLREHGTPVGMGSELPADEYECCADALLPLIAAECSEAARQAAEGIREAIAVRIERERDAWIRLRDFAPASEEQLDLLAKSDMIERAYESAASLARQTAGCAATNTPSRTR